MIQFTREILPELLDFVSSNAKARWPLQTYLMTSDVAWQFPGCAPKDNIRIWKDEKGIAGYAWFQPASHLKFDLRPDISIESSLADEIMAWALGRREEFGTENLGYLDFTSMDDWAAALSGSGPAVVEEHALVTSAFESDRERSAFLEKQGFAVTDHYEPFLVRSLEDIPAADDRFNCRSVAEHELEDRVALHRAAWAPGSSFSLAQYQKVRAMQEVFDPDLDIVAVDDAGRFASYTIAWFDTSGIGSFEPFGTHPDYRGSGASQAVIYEGLRRMKARGMHAVRLYTACFNEPARRLYTGCGFEPVDRLYTWVRQTGGNN